MKKITASLVFLLLMKMTSAQQHRLTNYATELGYDRGSKLVFAKLQPEKQVRQSEVREFLVSMLFASERASVRLTASETDRLGFTHQRYQVTVNGYDVEGRVLIAHFREGKLFSLNGDLSDLPVTALKHNLTEAQALSAATSKIGAKRYKWENAAEEKLMKEALNDPAFSYYPHASVVFYETAGQLVPAYKFNIYADEPLYRADVFVDATNGNILAENSQICTADVPGIAHTKYSGVQNFTCDQFNSIYRLREVGRGLGVYTYNMKNTTNYGTATDFTNAATSWTSTGVDQGATDAHWGAEMTYDYLLNVHNRNSINNAGYQLVSFVHYSNNYTNAFWDGQRMTYGDGNNGSMKIFTTLDICGHEITHGLTSNTAKLVYSYESGALNESYSDIFGVLIENYGRPGNWNWKVGEDMTSNGNGLRSMSNPKSMGDPNCYMGQYYTTGSADNGGVHTNSGVSNYWFYLLSMGGAGTNDLGQSYNISGIGLADAGAIAYRALTVYYTPNTNFAQARLLSIQAAKDLFGDCSNQVMQTINAWHAVGVGQKFVPTALNPNFSSSFQNFCKVPATVTFSNTTPYAGTYSWDFGDGGTATTFNAQHTYTTSGSYTVKLKAVGCNNLTDSIIKSAHIVVNIPLAPAASGTLACENSTVTLTATGNSSIKWFDNPAAVQPLAVGNVFNAPITGTAVTYYAASSVTNAPATGGFPSATNGGYISNAAPYLIFDVTDDATLNSVIVYASSNGPRTFELRNSSGGLISTLTVTLSVGTNTVPLNFNLNVGTGYQLGLSPGSVASLYRSNSGTNYPYAIGGCVNIVNSSVGTGSYYWFYKWTVTKAECLSPFTPVSMTVIPAPQVNLTTPASVVCKDDEVVLHGSPSGGTFSGPGVNAGVFSASALGAGYYNVGYSVTDNNGCTATAQTQLIVEECTGITTVSGTGKLSIFPNPARTSLTIKNAGEGDLITISDAAGRQIIRTLLTGNENSIEVEQLPNGIYLVKVISADGSLHTLKLVKN